MSKRRIIGNIFAIALILVLTLAMGGNSVMAVEPTIIDSGTCGANGDNVTWTLDSTGLLTISGEGEMCGYAYTTDPYITTAPWKNRASNVLICEGVTSIGGYAFYGCSGLTSVTIPDSVTSIGEEAFSGCTGLTEIQYNAKSVADFSSNPFIFYSAGIVSGDLRVVIGDSVERIPARLFDGCTGLTSVTIGSGVTSIGESAFPGCTGLTSVAIPDSVTSIGDSAFDGCTGLTSVTIPDSVTSIGKEAFSGCTSLASVTIGNGVTSIGGSAFYGCTGLTDMTIGSGVASIGNYAFYNCTGLTEIHYNAKSVADLSYNSDVFYNAGKVSGDLRVVFGDSVEKIPAYLFHGCRDLTSVTIPDSVSSIGESAFPGCTGLTSVAIPDSVTSIGNSAFSSCTGLTEIHYNAKSVADLGSGSNVFANAGASNGLRVVFGDSVERIPSCLFYGCSGLTSVTIPDSVTSIGGSAFSYCSGLTSVTIPDSVTSIGDSVFSGCSGLTSVTIPDSVSSIEYGAFYGCTGLTSVTIGSGVASIGNHAFSGCTGLTEIHYNAKSVADLESGSNVFANAGASNGLRVVFGDSVERIPSCLFYGCSGLTSVTIGNGVTSIGDYAFYNCTGLTSVTIGSGVTSIGNYAFDGCTGLTSVTIGSGVTSIGGYAFNGCSGLTSVAIPNSVTNIGSGAFRGCTGLTSVTIPDSVTSIGMEAFSGCTGLTSVTIGSGVTSIGYSAFYGCTGLTSVTIPNSVTSIGYHAFDGCTGLTEIHYNAKSVADFSSNSYVFENAGIVSGDLRVVFGDSVEKIPAYLFYNCTGLTSVTIPNSVTSIGYHAFDGCTGLTEIHYNAKSVADFSYNSNVFYNAGKVSGDLRVVFGDGVEKIPACLFYGCTGLTDVTIPDSVTSIGASAFSGCTGLTDVTIGIGVTSIGGSAFDGCTGLTSVTIPDSVTSIGKEAFSGCTGLTSVTIGSGVTSIGGYAFSGCTGLTDMTIGSGVASIGNYAFKGCTGLTSVTIPDSVTSIGEEAFSGCTGLTEIQYNAKSVADLSYNSDVFENAGKVSGDLRVVFGDSVERIPSYLFKGCTGLTSVTIGSGVTSIGGSAFYNCTGLTDVTIPDSVTNIGGSAFDGCTGLTSVTIPDSVTSFGDSAFSGCTGLTEIQYNAKSVADSESYSNVFYNAGKVSGDLRVVFGDGVERIPADLFYACPSLTSVTIPDSVASIGNSAFSGCTGLTEIHYNAKSVADLSYNSDVFENAGKVSGDLRVVFGDGVERIPAYLFSGCPSLTSVTIGSGVASIGGSAFYNCTGLTSVTIPDSVTSIGSSAFRGCTGLTSVTIPDSVTSIGDSVFDGCTGLTSVTIGNGVTSIGYSAFYGCTGMTEIHYNAKSVADLSYNSDVFENAGKVSGDLRVVFGDGVEKIPAYLFSGCPSLTSVTIGSGVTSIGGSAFYNCTGLTDVTIPDSVASIGNSAFSGCTGLTEIHYNAKSVADLSYNSDVFENAGKVSGDLRVVFGDGVERIPAYLFYNCTGLTSVTIGSGVASIGNYAFRDCTGLTSVTIPDSVTSIGNSAFSYCTGLTSVTIPDSVTSIGGSAFSYCTGLTSVTIPDSVTSIGDSAFSYCTGLTSVTIPDSVTSIGDSAFDGCTGLTSVTIGSGVTSIGNYAFSGCTGLTSVTIDNGVTSIGDSAFYGCTGLTSVTIPDSVTSIGRSAFEGCTGLTEIHYNAKSVADSESYPNVFYNAGIVSGDLRVVIGDSVERIPARLFYGCTGLTSVTIGNGVTSIGDYAFSYCTGLTSVTIGNGVTSIGNYAFDGCTGLTSVTIGNGVTNIGYFAFSGCTGLTEIQYNAKAAADLEYGSNVFYNAGTASDGIKVFFGESVKKIPSYLLYGVDNIRCFVFAGNPPTVGYCGLGNFYTYALYPVHNSAWSESARKACGSNLTWIGCCTEPVSSAACKIGTTAYLPDSLLDTNSISMTLTHEDGCAETIPYGSRLLELGSYEMSTPGEKVIDVTYKGNTAQVKVYVHERKTETLDKAGYPESNHTYENNLDKTYTYKAEGATSLDVTFSAQTEVETNIDYLYVNGTEYTGTELAGKTITINGDTLTIRLVSDASEGAYGFSIDSIVKTYMEHEYNNDTIVSPTCTEQGYTLRTCICGNEVKQDYVPALGHDMVTDAAVAPTCTETGLTAGSHCSRCDEATTAQTVVPALGHDMVTDAAVAPTCTETGLTAGSHCSRCDEATTAQTAVPALGHDMVTDAAVAPTCTETGLTAGSHCSRCDEATTAQTVVPALGHHFNEKHVCEVCGAKDPNYKLIAPTVKADYLISTGKPYLKWDAVVAADKYEVYRSGSKNGTYTLLGTTTATNYTDSKANAGYTYYYKVKAVAAVGTKSDDSAVVAGICHCARPKVTPDYLTSTGKPYIKWTAVAGADKYYVYRSGSSSGTYEYIGTTTVTNYTDSKANAGYTYYYKVKAVSKVRSEANSYYSAVVAGICHCARPEVTPDYLTSTGKPYIKWTAVAGADKYYVYRSGSSSGTYEYIGTTTVTNYTDSKANAGYTYYYKVKAVSKVRSEANSYYSAAIGATCHCAKPSVKITTSNGSPKLTWNAVAGAGQYEIYRATSQNGTYTKMYTTTGLSYTNTSAVAGTTYYYKVKAVSKVKSTANSAFSSVVSIKAR